MLSFILRRCGLNPASPSAPFVATLVDVTHHLLHDCQSHHAQTLKSIAELSGAREYFQPL
jgi:hypothetical protein